MGSTRKVKYIVEVVVPGFSCTPMEWRVGYANGCRGYGQPTKRNLAEYVRTSNEATEPGGVNAYLGVNHKIVSAAIFLNNGKHDTLIARV